MTTPEQQEKEMVEMFLGTCSQFDWNEQTGWIRNKSATIEKATEAAILHVEKVIEVLESTATLDYGFTLTLRNHYQQLSTILKNKL